MRGLKGLLIKKIALTLLFVCIPLLFFPISAFQYFGIQAPEPLIFVRLLGVAYLALVVGYIGGIKLINNNQSPIHAIDMGIVSNGAAALTILYFGVTGSWSNWGNGAQIYMWCILAASALMTVNLCRARLRYV